MKKNKLIKLERWALDRYKTAQTNAAYDEQFIEHGGRNKPRYKAVQFWRSNWKKLNEMVFVKKEML